MEDATPIYQLQQQQRLPHQGGGVDNQQQVSRKEPLEMMSYNDILKNMSEQTSPVVEPKPIVPSSTGQQHLPPQQQLPPTDHYPHHTSPPVTNNNNGGGFPGLAYHPKPVQQQQQQHTPVTKPVDDVTFQNEMLSLLGVYILVHTQRFQKTLQNKVPGMFQENGLPSVVGILMNGALVIVMWNVFKKFLLKYMKDM